MKKPLIIQKSKHTHPDGQLWQPVNPDEAHIFRHFVTNHYCGAILEDFIPNLIDVADLHGWEVVKKEYEEYPDKDKRQQKLGPFNTGISLEERKMTNG